MFKVPWSYPENLEAIALPIPEFLADKETDTQTNRHMKRLMYIDYSFMGCCY